MKITNAEHIAINGNHSKCRMTHLLQSTEKVKGRTLNVECVL